MKIGSHVSNKAPDMLLGSLKEALSYNATSFMVYLGAPQNLIRKSADELKAKAFLEALNENCFSREDVIVHAPYIMNLAQSDEQKQKYAIAVLTNELKLTYEAGLKYLVVHPGNKLSLSIDDALLIVSQSIKEALLNTKDTDTTVLIETMAGKGSEVCKNFSELQTLLKLIDSERVAVCLDTCHTWDAGYDWQNNLEQILAEFDEKIGLERIKCIHLNDSKNRLGAAKDRHENIGHGHIGFDTLIKLAHHPKFSGVPKILETPYIVKNGSAFAPYKEEIEMIRTKTFIDIKK